MQRLASMNTPVKASTCAARSHFIAYVVGEESPQLIIELLVRHQPVPIHVP